MKVSVANLEPQMLAEMIGFILDGGRACRRGIRVTWGELESQEIESEEWHIFLIRDKEIADGVADAFDQYPNFKPRRG